MHISFLIFLKSRLLSFQVYTYVDTSGTDLCKLTTPNRIYPCISLQYRKNPGLPPLPLQLPDRHLCWFDFQSDVHTNLE